MTATDAGAASADRERLVARLREAGADDEEIERAAAEERLPTLAVELALGGAGRHSLTHVARESGLAPAFLRELMQAVGRPNPGRGERIFTDEDVETARVMKRFVDAGLPRRELLEVGRVVGQGMAHTSEAVRHMVGNALLRPGDSEYTVGLRFAQAADELAPLVPTLLDHQFRAHLRDGMRRELVSESERESGRLAGTRDVAIAFADLVGYTRLGEQLPSEDLGRIAGRFASLAVGSVRRPATLIKTIGDGAMFASSEVPALIATLQALVASVAQEGERFPHVRVGVAYGPATTRGGDWFGSTVNVASRVTEIARPGRILATEGVRDLAPDEPWQRRRRRANLKGVDGRLRLFSLDEQDADS
jgi:adenylate cyclase